jgi:hypothetical protein
LEVAGSVFLLATMCHTGAFWFVISVTAKVSDMTGG